MVANIRCMEIKNDQLKALTGDQAWAALQGEATQQPPAVVPGFGQRAQSLLDSCAQG